MHQQGLECWEGDLGPSMRSRGLNDLPEAMFKGKSLLSSLPCDMCVLQLEGLIGIQCHLTFFPYSLRCAYFCFLKVQGVTSRPWATDEQILCTGSLVLHVMQNWSLATISTVVFIFVITERKAQVIGSKRSPFSSSDSNELRLIFHPVQPKLQGHCAKLSTLVKWLLQNYTME